LVSDDVRSRLVTSHTALFESKIGPKLKQFFAGRSALNVVAEVISLDKLVEMLLPGTPRWLIVPGTVILLILLAWPVLSEIWTGVLPSYRRYTREKRRLELLKTYYEIEAIRKEHDLGEPTPIATDTFKAIVQPSNAPNGTVATARDDAHIPLSSRQRFGWGAVGSLGVFATTFFIQDFADLSFLNAAVFFGLLIRGIVLIFIGGLTAWLSSPNTIADAMVRGAIIPLFLTLLIAGQTQKIGQDLPGPRAGQAITPGVTVTHLMRSRFGGSVHEKEGESGQLNALSP
jgi:hypothetical protein